MSTSNQLAAQVASRIATGELASGARLPTHRRFAREHNVALSTASRVYAQLMRDGLVVAVVGRGTFVRDGAVHRNASINEPVQSVVDLEYNFPIVAGQAELLSPTLERMARADTLARALTPSTAEGTPAARDAVKAGLIRNHGLAAGSAILFTGTGRQAIAAAFAASAGAGRRIGVEELTYPLVRGIAAQLGIELVPLPIDSDGLDPEAALSIHRRHPLAAVYLQPELHNPLGVRLGDDRRAALHQLATENDLVIIEDGIYSFLHDRRAFAADAPDRTIFVDSMSKRVAPGLTTGILVAPARMEGRLAAAVRQGGYSAGRFALDALTGWINDGAVATIQRMKRDDAVNRQRAVRAHLNGLDIAASPEAYHAWWVLPDGWRADTMVAAAARAGIAVTPAADFAIRPADAPNAVRLALASPPIEELRSALCTLQTIASSPIVRHAE